LPRAARLGPRFLKITDCRAGGQGRRQMFEYLGTVVLTGWGRGGFRVSPSVSRDESLDRQPQSTFAVIRQGLVNGTS
jgi:hypothetical protein